MFTTSMLSEGLYDVFKDHKCIGQIYKEVDGTFCFGTLGSFVVFSSNDLKEIAKLVDGLNLLFGGMSNEH